MPMLFMMGAASHLPLPMPGSGAAFWIVALLIIALVEWNCPHRWPRQAHYQDPRHRQGHPVVRPHPHRDLLSALRGNEAERVDQRARRMGREAGQGAIARPAFVCQPRRSRRSWTFVASERSARPRSAGWSTTRETGRRRTRAPLPAGRRSARNGRPQAFPSPRRVTRFELAGDGELLAHLHPHRRSRCRSP